MTKAETTRSRILDAALDLFQSRGFDATTMRDVASRAAVATGAAYYYFDSKEAIVMAFYQRAMDQMQPLLDDALDGSRSFEAGLDNLIRIKLEYFAPHRSVLRALLRNGADPAHPLSPFSDETKAIRESDTSYFTRLLERHAARTPRDFVPHLPGILWLYQMGVIFFWVIDDSAQQKRSFRLLKQSAGLVSGLLKLSSLPLTRPLRKPLIDLIETVTGA